MNEVYSVRDMSDNFQYQRRRAIYEYIAQEISGDVLEISDCYPDGIDLIAPRVRSLTIVSRHACRVDTTRWEHVEFYRLTHPPFIQASGSFDCIISYHVLVHVRDDFEMIRELHRMLKPGGRLILISPNRRMSLTRNPWYVREYLGDELCNLLRYRFREVDRKGVFGNSRAMTYYEKSRQFVQQLLRHDLLKLHCWLPRVLFRIPYSLYYRMTRRKIFIANRTLTCSLTSSDYYVAPASESCFDWVYIATY